MKNARVDIRCEYVFHRSIRVSSIQLNNYFFVRLVLSQVIQIGYSVQSLGKKFSRFIDAFSALGVVTFIYLLFSFMRGAASCRAKERYYVAAAFMESITEAITENKRLKIPGKST